MRIYGIILLGILLMGTLAVCAGNSNQTFNQDDLKAVKQACLDYVEGYYESNGERVAKGVHADLVKRSIKNDTIIEMSRAKLIEAATSKQRTKPEITVEVFDIYGNIAIAKITSGFVDYAELAKINNNWQVVNVLWSNK
jgi:hypothetical protein